MAVPLRTKHEIVGVLLLGPPDGRVRTFTRAEKQLLSSAADVFALLIENARLNDRALEQEKVRRDLALAAEVQRRLLPLQPPRCAGRHASRRSRCRRGPSAATTTTSSICRATGSASRWPISPARGSRRRC